MIKMIEDHIIVVEQEREADRSLGGLEMSQLQL